MNSEIVSHFYGHLEKEGVLLSYQGPFWQEMVEEITTVVSSRLEDIADRQMSSRNVGLCIELTQNILRYSCDRATGKDGAEFGFGTVLSGVQEGGHYIISGNPVAEPHRTILKERLEQLKACTEGELNALYKEQLHHGEKNSRGAGLGLIEVFRKADTVDYSFSELDSGKTFFSIRAGFHPPVILR